MVEIPVWKIRKFWALKFNDKIIAYPSGCCFSGKTDLAERFFKNVIKEVGKNNLRKFEFVARERVNTARIMYPTRYDLECINSAYDDCINHYWIDKAAKMERAKMEQSLRNPKI